MRQGCVYVHGQLGSTKLYALKKACFKIHYKLYLLYMILFYTKQTTTPSLYIITLKYTLIADKSHRFLVTKTTC
jgi:hypothetical protein